MAEKNLHIDLVAADRAIWSGAAKMVIAKTVEGEVGLLAGHEPILAILSSGEVRITLPTGEKVTAKADGGFIEMDHDVVTIFARNAALD